MTLLCGLLHTPQDKTFALITLINDIINETNDNYDSSSIHPFLLSPRHQFGVLISTIFYLHSFFFDGCTYNSSHAHFISIPLAVNIHLVFIFFLHSHPAYSCLFSFIIHAQITTIFPSLPVKRVAQQCGRLPTSWAVIIVYVVLYILFILRA